MDNLKSLIETAWENRALLEENTTKEAVRTIVDLLDKGDLRVAEPTADGWQVNEWVKKAVVMYFPIQTMETIEVGPFEFHDKIPLKTGYAEKGIRVVPPCGSASRRIHFKRYDFNAELCEYWSLC